MLQPPSKRAEQIMFAVFALIVVGLFAAEVARDYRPAKLGALFCVLMWVPLLVVHELGHAVVARLFGCHIEYVSLGMGRTLWEIEVWGVPVEIHAFPVEGYVRPGFAERPLSRIQNALIYFAGPGFELLLASIVLAIVGPDTLFNASEHIRVIALQSLCICIAFSVIVNLVPHTSGRRLDDEHHGRAPTPNDGLGIVLSLLGRIGR